MNELFVLLRQVSSVHLAASGKVVKTYIHLREGDSWLDISVPVATLLGKPTKRVAGFGVGIQITGWSTKHYEAFAAELNKAIGFDLRLCYVCAIVGPIAEFQLGQSLQDAYDKASSPQQHLPSKMPMFTKACSTRYRIPDFGSTKTAIQRGHGHDQRTTRRWFPAIMATASVWPGTGRYPQRSRRNRVPRAYGAGAMGHY